MMSPTSPRRSRGAPLAASPADSIPGPTYAWSRAMTAYPDFHDEARTYEGETRRVYRKGRGPAVIVMHEIPGLYPEVVAFARRVVDAGFTVYMPSLVGTPGRAFGPAYSLQSMARACVAREFTTWAV